MAQTNGRAYGEETSEKKTSSSPAAKGFAGSQKTSESKGAEKMERMNEKSITNTFEKTAEKLKDSAGTAISSALSALPLADTTAVYAVVETAMKGVTKSLSVAQDAVVTFVKRHPFYALAGAVVIGASIGFALNRRKSEETDDSLIAH